MFLSVFGLHFHLYAAYQSHRAPLQAAIESAPGTRVYDIAKLFAREVKELVEVNAAVAELSEGSLLLDLWLPSISTRSLKHNVLHIPSSSTAEC